MCLLTKVGLLPALSNPPYITSSYDGVIDGRQALIKTYTTLNGGSLGSWVDEDRS